MERLSQQPAAAAQHQRLARTTRRAASQSLPHYCDHYYHHHYYYRHHHRDHLHHGLQCTTGAVTAVPSCHRHQVAAARSRHVADDDCAALVAVVAVVVAVVAVVVAVVEDRAAEVELHPAVAGHCRSTHRPRHRRCRRTTAPSTAAHCTATHSVGCTAPIAAAALWAATLA